MEDTLLSPPAAIQHPRASSTPSPGGAVARRLLRLLSGLVSYWRERIAEVMAAEFTYEEIERARYCARCTGAHLPDPCNVTPLLWGWCPNCERRNRVDRNAACLSCGSRWTTKLGTKEGQ